MSLAVTFTIGAEAANARNVLVQLGSSTTRGSAPRNVGSKRALEMYLSTDAAGDTVINPVGTDIVPSVGAAGKLLDAPEATVGPVFRVKTDAAGKANVILTNAGDETETVYLNVIDPSTGKVVTSGAVAFADNTP